MPFSEQIGRILRSPGPLVRHFARMLEENAPLESLARRSQLLTRRNFGKAIRLFAPLYLSNECVNNCLYCGFSRDNPILRTTLGSGHVLQEALHLRSLGFRNLLLVAGEHPKFVSEGYLQEILRSLRESIPTLGVEVGPMEDTQYAELVRCGAEGLVVYQETYCRTTYETLHTAGPKKNYHWRLDCPERAYAGGFRRIGIGALFGLAPWKEEALALAAHLEFLQRHCWKASFTVSFPRLRPHAGNHLHTPDPSLSLGDRDLVRLVCAFRLCFPHTGIVLSTREPARLRNGLLPLGVTHASAGVRTNPGGYTGAGHDNLHLTSKGRRRELPEGHAACSQSTSQFEIADTRSSSEIADTLRRLRLDPVWKDWDKEILKPSFPDS